MIKLNKKLSYTLYILLCLVFLSSCSDKKARCYSCLKEDNLKVIEFVSKNIKNANNMSDEEMEDVITELRETGIKLYCNQIFVPTTWDNQIKYNEIIKEENETLHPFLY